MMPTLMSQAFDPELATRIESFGVIAVLVVDRADDAIPLARALLDGGVNEKNMAAYLGEPMVGALGGSWLAPRELIHAGDWKAITARCSAATEIIRSTRKAS